MLSLNFFRPKLEDLLAGFDVAEANVFIALKSRNSANISLQLR